MNYRVRESLELEKKKKILKFPLLPQMAQLVKNLPASAGDTRDMGSIPGSGRAPGGGSGNPTPVILSRKSHAQRSLESCSPWGHKRVSHDKVII